MSRHTGAVRRLAEVADRLDADQAEHALSRLREADQGYEPDHPTVAALLARLETVGGKRKAAAARKWFDPDVAKREQRRADRAEHGTLKEQRVEFAAYLSGYADRLEAATRGNHLKAGTRDRGGMTMAQLLASNPATMRKHLSDEAMEHIGRTERPLSFDAWRYSMLGARDSRAVESWQRRQQADLGEWG